MHKGVFKGAHAAGDRNVLVLGESHHYMVADDPEYTTEGVVNNYFKHPNDKCYRFFDKIVKCFGFLPDEREQFWDRVWFGNYVEESNCGVGDSRARDLVEKHKERYNKDLFLFVNEHEIDIICCFSRLVYWNLPSRAIFEEKETQYDVPKLHGRRDYISKFLYLPGARPDCEVALKKQLLVYGFRHPSARDGFDATHYVDVLKGLVQRPRTP